MPKTRSLRAGSKNPRSSAKRSYRKRGRASKCRGLNAAKCSKASRCKMAVGRNRSFCRKVCNSYRRRSCKRS